MTRLTFITCSGDEVVVDTTEPNVMLAAVDNNVDGIHGDCGGVCSCGTCHVHVDPGWIDRVGPASDVELGTLELEDDYCEASRLGCQIELTPQLDGLVVRVVGQ